MRPARLPRWRTNAGNIPASRPPTIVQARLEQVAASHVAKPVEDEDGALRDRLACDQLDVSLFKPF